MFEDPSASSNTNTKKRGESNDVQDDGKKKFIQQSANLLQKETLNIKVALTNSPPTPSH